MGLGSAGLRVDRRSRLLLVVLTVAAVVTSGLAWAGPASAAVGTPVTYPGHAYSAAVANPSADKPQSKLWYHDGTWWSLMVQSGGTAVTIHRLDRTGHTWQDTGTLVDDRVNSTGDALFSGRDGRLYVASRVAAGTAGAQLEVNAFSYGAGTWSAVPGFPVVAAGGGSESATIDQDSLGNLWVTYTQGSRLWVTHSTDLERKVWTPGFQPAVGDTVIDFDDISALIAFGTSIGVLWSDQQSGAVRFAVHADGAPDTAWTVEDVPLLAGLADDHINIKQIAGDPQGRIFAAIKTSADEVASPVPTDTLVGVLTRTPGTGGGAGTWALAPAATVAEGYTRPMIMIDSENRELFFFATTGVGGPDIVVKRSPLDRVDFSASTWQPFVDATFSVNNASGAKDPVTSTTDLVVLASSGGQDRYAHAEADIAPGGGGTADPAPVATPTSPAAGATGVPIAANVTATFGEHVTGVDGSTFTLRAGSTAVPATVSYDPASHVATLDPTSDLVPGTGYTASLGGQVLDSAGQALTPNPTTWSFTTASAVTTSPVSVRTRSPAPDATGIGVAANVTATFTAAVQGVDATSFRLSRKVDGASVQAGVSRNGTTNQWILNPGSNLAPDTRYVATLTGGASAIRDTSGRPLASSSWEFTTGPAPRVSARTPAVNATGVRRDANITATFSEAVQSVSGQTFSVRVGTGPAVAAVVSRNGSTNQWVLNPDQPLASGTQYTVTVSGGPTGITDLAGNPLATVTWRFTTGTAL